MAVSSIGRLLLSFMIAGPFFHRSVTGFDSARKLRYSRVMLGPEATDIDIRVHTRQSIALLEIFAPLNVLSLQWLNWNFLDGPAEYCYFVGIECDIDGYISGIDLSNQGLVGTLPDLFGHLTRLRRFAIFGNKLSGQLPQSLLALTSLNKFNAGQNSFSGPFPVLQPSLTRVVLDRNYFSGTIPSSICELKELELLDLTAITNMSGTLPNCLGSLTALTLLRVTDVGLGGTVPESLCTQREMNGFTPNTFGCDAIACGPGFYQRPSGRQTDPNSPCLMCDVPSNAIGSSSCRWLPPLIMGPSDEPRTNPSTPPTMEPSEGPDAMPSTRNSNHPTISQRPPSDVPSQSPYSTIQSSTEPPTVEPSPLRSPVAKAVAGKRSNEAWRSKLYIAAGVLIPASLCIMLPFLFALRYHARNRKEEITESTELLAPDITRSSDSLDESLDRITNAREASSPDDSNGSTTDPVETNTGSTGRAETQKKPSWSSCRNNRRVTFRFPETIPEDPSGESLAAQEDEDGDEQLPFQGEVLSEPPSSPNDVAPTDDFKSSSITRWLDSPIFFPLRSCQAPCAMSYGSTPEETSTSTMSLVVDTDAAATDHEPEESPTSGRTTPSTITMDYMEISQSGDELEAVLGIRNPRPAVAVAATTTKPPPALLRPEVHAYQLALALIRGSAKTNGTQPNHDDDDDDDEVSSATANMPLYGLDENYHDVVDDNNANDDDDDDTRGVAVVAASTSAADIENNNAKDHSHHRQPPAGFCFLPFDQS
jgi:hypothetical protein